ncbi:THAP domain-containing protein 6-like [Achroia grisella]|uniref:THAP domain-containing protein 6-like n=1 Tax=Achroia grisella TaxID=688607 RepID=UPI0027D247D1|nr:THAP domain-containing protein 6-like [Achroia grisella]
MPSCVVSTCRNNSMKQQKAGGITYHKFPNDNFIKYKWIQIIRISRKDTAWLPARGSVVCSLHFADKDLYITKAGLRRIVKYGIPKKILIDRNSDIWKEDAKVCQLSTVRLVPNSNNVSDDHDSDEDTKELVISHENETALTASETEDELEDIKSNINIDYNKHIESIIVTLSPDEASYSVTRDNRDKEVECVFDSSETNELRMKLKKQIQKSKVNRKKMKVLNQRIRRLARKNAKLVNVIRELRGKLNGIGAI